MAAVYDVIVVGAGVEGSSSAYSLVKSGKKVLLLEQFPLPHSRGSSHGQSRITRYAYPDDFYVRMMVDAFPLWDKLQEESKTNFFINCGTLDLRTEKSAGFKSVAAGLRKYNVPHEVLTPRELQRRFPLFTAGKNVGAVWDPSGGLLQADKVLAAYQKVFQELGGVLRDNEPVTSISPGQVVTVATAKSVYTAHSLVICAGPWTGPLSASLGLQLPLSPIRVSVLYWKAKENLAEDFAASNFPCFLDSRLEGTGSFHVYGLPLAEYPGLVKVSNLDLVCYDKRVEAAHEAKPKQICLHEGPVIDPNDRDKNVDDTWVVDSVREIVASTFPGLEPTPIIKEYCMYTLTPDGHPFIDCHPRYENIVVAAGFNGHGFKLAPAVGKAVKELVLKKELTYNMQPFKLNRFSPQANL